MLLSGNAISPQLHPVDRSPEMFSLVSLGIQLTLAVDKRERSGMAWLLLGLQDSWLGLGQKPQHFLGHAKLVSPLPVICLCSDMVPEGAGHRIVFQVDSIYRCFSFIFHRAFFFQTWCLKSSFSFTVTSSKQSATWSKLSEQPTRTQSKKKFFFFSF